MPSDIYYNVHAWKDGQIITVVRDVQFQTDAVKATQELHDAGELPLCRKCAREIGWDSLTLGRYNSDRSQTCNDCLSDERLREE
jgi:hypothetical protein